MILEFPHPPELSCSAPLRAGIDEIEKVRKPWSLKVPECLWASSMYKGKIKSSEPIKIQIGHSKCLPKSPKYPLKLESTLGLLPTVEDLSKDVFRALVPMISNLTH